MYVIITICFSLILGTVGFFLFPKGEVYGFIFACIYIVLSSLVLHKLFLSQLYPRELQIGHPLRVLSDSICTQLHCPLVKIYCTDKLSRNIYLLDSFLGSPILIVGSDFFDELSEQSSKDLLRLVYAPLGHFDVLRKTQIVWMVSLLWLPVALLEQVYFIRMFTWIIKFILLPIVWLKNLLIEEQKISGQELINLGIQPSLKNTLSKSKYLRLLETDFSIIQFEQEDLASTLLKLPTSSYLGPSKRSQS